ncbi:MAG: glycosyltransferase family 4 protein [Synechococcaceae cyanobacterium]
MEDPRALAAEPGDGKPLAGLDPTGPATPAATRPPLSAVVQLVPDLRRGGGLADLAAGLLPGVPCLDAERFRCHPPRSGTLVVHYSGYGFAANGAPTQLVRELIAWRQQAPGRRLLVWVHELYARQMPWRKGFWWAPRQKRVVERLAASADGVITNLERHDRWLRRRRLPPSAVFPVPSNVGEPIGPQPLGARQPRMVVFGGPAQRLAAYRALRHRGPWLRQLGLEAIDDIGEPLPYPPRAPLPVQVHGRLPAPLVSERLHAARAAAVAYPLDFVAKSGIFAAIAAHGCLPLLLGSGPRRGPCDGLGRGVQLLTPPGAPQQPEAIAAAACHWYQPHRLAVQRRWLRAWLEPDGPGLDASGTLARGPDGDLPHIHASGREPIAAGSRPWPERPLRLLLYCHAYLPSLGGLERAGQLLAEQLSAPPAGSGIEALRVDLVTATPATDPAWDQAQPYRIWRRPCLWTRLQLVSRADVVHSNGSSLAVSLLAALLRKPLLITHQGYQLVSVDGLGWGDEGPTPLSPSASLAWYRSRLPWAAWIRQVLLLRLRRWVAMRASANVAISTWVDWRQPLPRRRLIPNPVALQPLSHAAASPQATPATPVAPLRAQDAPADLAPSLRAWRQRPWELVFLGRLVQEKGLDVLLRALPLLEAATGLRPRLRVIGDGPMASDWRDLARQLGVEAQVRFVGSLHGAPLARALSECRIGVVPSVWEEPMGMVAAEFLAAGVVPVVSERGGLAEVVGAAGLSFSNGDANALAAQLEVLLADPVEEASLPAACEPRTEIASGLSPGSSAGVGPAAASGTWTDAPTDPSPAPPRTQAAASARLATLIRQAPVQLRQFDPTRIAARYALLYRSLLGC